MANSTLFKSHWLLLALLIPSLPDTPTPSHPRFIPLQNQSFSLSEIAIDKQRRPRGRLGGRNPASGNVCVVSPGLLELRNVIWSDRPLFVWSGSSDVTMERIQLLDQTRSIVWEKSLAPADRTAQYDGQPLQPGQFYTWRLYWRMRNAENSEDYTFQLMEADQRNQITADLQTLTRQLQSSQLSPEAIANQQINYLVNRSEPLWSDAIQVLYSIENPSPQTTQQIQTWISTACGDEV